MEITARSHGYYGAFWMTVSKEDYIALKGTEPNENLDSSYSDPGTYKIYMCDIVPELSPNLSSSFMSPRFKVKIERFELEGGEMATVIRTKKIPEEKKSESETPVDFL